MSTKNVSKSTSRVFKKAPTTTLSLYKKRSVGRRYRRSRHVSHRYGRPHKNVVGKMWNPSYRSIVPSLYFSRLRFISGFINATCTTAIQWFAFSPNGLVQPQLTQPSGTTFAPANANIGACTDAALGLEELTPLYVGYRVGACTVRIEGNVNESNEPIFVFLGSDSNMATADAFNSADLRTALMERNVSHKLYNADSPINFKKKFYINRVIGVSKNQTNGNKNLSGALDGSNPVEGGAIWVGFATAGLTGSTVVNARVYIEYEAKFYEPQNVNAITVNIRKKVEAELLAQQSPVSSKSSIDDLSIQQIKDLKKALKK